MIRCARHMLLALGVVLLAACALPPVAQRDASLYHALHEGEGIQRLVDALLKRVYADQRIAFLFQNTDRPNLNQLIVEQICAESGGPCVYSGRSMEETHGGLALKHKEFDNFVEDFTDAMEDVGLDYPTQNRLLRIFAPMRGEIVDK